MAARKRSKRQLSKAGQAVLLALALLLVGGLGYLVLVRPKQAEAKRLEEQIAALEARYATEAAKAGVKPPVVKAPELFRLAKAMPDRVDMSGVILELNEVAADTGIVFESITPGTAAPRDGYQALPVDVVFEGDFYSLSDFLFRLRNLVRLDEGRLEARGRLFAIDSITFAESARRFPRLHATLRVNAFVYGSGAPAPAAPPPATTTTTGAATTTGTTTTETAPATTAADPSQPPAAPAAGGTG